MIPDGPLLAFLGSQHWDNPDEPRDFVDGYLKSWHAKVISGGSVGVCQWVREACERMGRLDDLEEIKPVWTRPDGTYNRLVGFERSEKIIRKATHVIVVWNGTSPGSKHEIDLALRYRKELRVHYPISVRLYLPADTANPLI